MSWEWTPQLEGVHHLLVPISIPWEQNLSIELVLLLLVRLSPDYRDTGIQSVRFCIWLLYLRGICPVIFGNLSRQRFWGSLDTGFNHLLHMYIRSDNWARLGIIRRKVCWGRYRQIHQQHQKGSCSWGSLVASIQLIRWRKALASIVTHLCLWKHGFDLIDRSKEATVYSLS